MFIEQGINTENKFWKYLIGLLLLCIATVVGQLPLLVGIWFKVNNKEKKYPIGNQELMSFFGSNTTLLLILIPSVFALIALYFIVKYWHNQTFLSMITARKSIDFTRFFFSFTIWGFFIIISTVVTYYLSPSHFVFNFKLLPFLILTIIAILLIPIQTSLEELVFRGYLMQGIANFSKNKWFPLLISSIIFGLMHLSNPEVSKMGNIIMIYYIGTGFFLGTIALMDNGLELALGFHAANNLLSALLVTSDWTAFQTHSVLKDISEPDIIYDIILPILVFYPLLLFIFSHKYKWHNWQEKLTGTIKNKHKTI